MHESFLDNLQLDPFRPHRPSCIYWCMRHCRRWVSAPGIGSLHHWNSLLRTKMEPRQSGIDGWLRNTRIWNLKLFKYLSHVAPYFVQCFLIAISDICCEFSLQIRSKCWYWLRLKDQNVIPFHFTLSSACMSQNNYIIKNDKSVKLSKLPSLPLL